MLLLEIEGSTNVAAAGFEGGTIRVLFRSGHWRDFSERTADEFAEFLAAPSKGRFVHERLNGRQSLPAPTRLDTFDPDDCCGPRLQSALRAGQVGGGGVLKWECPKCGCEWTAEPTPLGWHWRQVTWAVRL